MGIVSVGGGLGGRMGVKGGDERDGDEGGVSSSSAKGLCVASGAIISAVSRSVGAGCFRSLRRSVVFFDSSC